MMTFLSGVFCGYCLVIIGQYGLERGYVKDGIAKFCGKYYKITPLDIGGENNGK